MVILSRAASMQQREEGSGSSTEVIMAEVEVATHDRCVTEP